MKRWVLLLLGGLMMMSLVSALDVASTMGDGIYLSPPVFNNNTGQVNMSDFWDDLDTPANIFANGMWTRTGTEITQTNSGDNVIISNGNLTIGDTDVKISRSALNVMQIDASRIHLIGATDANTELRIQADASEFPRVTFYEDSTLEGLIDYHLGNNQLRFSNQVSGGTGIVFITRGEDRLLIEDRGNVAIGIGDATDRLHVNTSSSDVARFEST